MDKIYKVGDELAFRSHGIGGGLSIRKIDKITPSGRLVCGSHTLNPDLTLRGNNEYSSRPYRGLPVTPQIREEFERARNLQIVMGCNWRKLSPDLVASIARIISSQ